MKSRLAEVALKESSSRWLHPLAWWAWGLSAAITALLIDNVFVHASMLFAIFTVMYQKRSTASWSNSVVILLRLVIFIVAFRVFIEIVFGVHFGGPVLIELPTITLPNWLGGTILGGKVGASGLVAAFIHGLKLATVLVAASAPAVMVPSNLLLKSLPNAIYEAGLVTVIAIGFLPTLSSDAKRLQISATLRGNSATSVRQKVRLLMPLIDSSLNRAVTLSNAMESRGFGRTQSTKSNSHLISLTLIGGFILLLVSTLQLMRSELNNLNLFLFITAIAFLAFSVHLSGKSRIRTKYQSLEFSKPEIYVTLISVTVILIGISQPVSFLFSALLLLTLLLLPIWAAPRLPVGFQR